MEWVESTGLKVDDPYGSMKKSNLSYKDRTNDAAQERGDKTKGEDSLWDWQHVAFDYIDHSYWRPGRGRGNLCRLRSRMAGNPEPNFQRRRYHICA